MDQSSPSKVDMDQLRTAVRKVLSYQPPTGDKKNEQRPQSEPEQQQSSDKEPDDPSPTNACPL